LEEDEDEIELFRTSSLNLDELENQTISEFEGRKQVIMSFPKQNQKKLAAYSTDYKFDIFTFVCCKA
jgi:hypothetical protein